jgi:FkbM family methyltransferase
MLITLDSLIEKYNIILKGILHVGAHECEELNDYEKYINRESILWIEAMPDKVQLNLNKYYNLKIEQAIVSDEEVEVLFNCSNNGQSSSFLELGLHSEFYPGIVYVNSFTQKTQLLENIIAKYNIDFNFINLDIQGAELKALKGMEKYLNKIDYIYTEVNTDYVYKDCAIITDIDDYLSKFNFIRVETNITPYKWGDAFYIKK